MLGIAVGSVIGGSLVANGRRRVIIAFNIIAILSTIMTLFLDYWLICAGRFIFGFSSGVLLAGAPKGVEETVPARLLDYGYGVSTNILINFAVMYSIVLGLGVPQEDSELATTNFWKIIYGV